MKRILVLVLISAVLTACNCRRTGSPILVILHTNDTHSHIEPEKSGEYKGKGGVLERAAFIDSVRTAEGEEKVLLLHAGDFGQGTSYYTTGGGFLEIDLINALGYDCVALGNHEFDNGIEDLTERVKKLKCPAVCANLDLSSFELGKYVKPYTILHRNSLKIGVIGLEADISTCISRSISSRIPVLDPADETDKWAGFLKHDEKCDMVILLSHLGYEEDKALLPKTHGIDIVIGGHTHTFVEDMVYIEDADGRKVPVITDGCWGLEMGKLSIYE